jgi:hypothetical protein
MGKWSREYTYFPETYIISLLVWNVIALIRKWQEGPAKSKEKEKSFNNIFLGQAWWYTSVIPVTREVEVEDCILRFTQAKSMRLKNN